MLKPVLCGGEVLLDFLSRDAGKGLAGTTVFEKSPGGSIFNVTVGLSRLGVPATLLTKLGGDEFGQGLMDVITEEGIGTECLKRDSTLKTTLAFVALDAEGKPEFRFYRDHAADTALTTADTERISPHDYSLYHFGSIALLEKPASDAYLELLSRFHEAKVLTSFDPNVRPSLISDRAAFVQMFDRICDLADIIKMSDDDLEYVTGLADVAEGLKMIRSTADALVLITLGRNGAMISYKGACWRVPTFASVNVLDTTGCGDSFMAAVIAGVLRGDGMGSLSRHTLTEVVTFANAAATIVGTRYGASNAMPHRVEVDEFLAARHEAAPPGASS